MYEIQFLVPIVVIYVVLNFLDIFFRSCMFFPYIKLLNDAGITIKPFMISWESSRFNRFIVKFGRLKPAFLRLWFQTGSAIVAGLIIPAMIFLLIPLYKYMFSSKNYGNLNEAALVPVIPGYNLPSSHLPYYILTIFVCVSIHEFGHAMAASREKLPTEGCGLALCVFLPIAYVKLPTEHLKNLTLPQQLRIYSAGIWHNIVLSAVALSLLWANSWFLTPLYQIGKGVTIRDVTQTSVLNQLGGFKHGDNVIAVNNCLIKHSNDWYNCLQKIGTEMPAGFCVSKNFLMDYEIYENGRSCNKNSSGCMCFEVLGYKNTMEACLPVRKLSEEPMCNIREDCAELCVLPLLESHSDRFFNFKRQLSGSVLFVGTVKELFEAVTVSSWVARYISVRFVDAYEMFLEYIVMFSSGIAIINIVPCFWLDGQYLTEGFVNFYLSSLIPLQCRRYILIFCMKITGCITILFTMALALGELNFFNTKP